MDTKTKNFLIVILIILVVAALVWFLIYNRRKDENGDKKWSSAQKVAAKNQVEDFLSTSIESIFSMLEKEGIVVDKKARDEIESQIIAKFDVAIDCTLNSIKDDYSYSYTMQQIQIGERQITYALQGILAPREKMDTKFHDDFFAAMEKCLGDRTIDTTILTKVLESICPSDKFKKCLEDIMQNVKTIRDLTKLDKNKLKNCLMNCKPEDIEKAVIYFIKMSLVELCKRVGGSPQAAKAIETKFKTITNFSQLYAQAASIEALMIQCMPANSREAVKFVIDETVKFIMATYPMVARELVECARGPISALTFDAFAACLKQALAKNPDDLVPIIKTILLDICNQGTYSVPGKLRPSLLLSGILATISTFDGLIKNAKQIEMAIVGCFTPAERNKAVNAIGAAFYRLCVQDGVVKFRGPLCKALEECGSANVGNLGKMLECMYLALASELGKIYK